MSHCIIHQVLDVRQCVFVEHFYLVTPQNQENWQIASPENPPKTRAKIPLTDLEISLTTTRLFSL